MRIRYKFLVFCFVGGIAAIIDFLFFNLFFAWVGFGFVISRILGILISMIWNFTMNKYITFKSKKGNIKKQVGKYLTSYGITMALNVLVGWIVLKLIGESWINGNIAVAAGLAVSIPLNFIFSLFWTFKEKTKKS